MSLDTVNRVSFSVDWVVKERQSGLWVVRHHFKNLITNFGLTALALAPSGTYIAPIYLVIENSRTTMSATGNIGDSSVIITADPTLSGDTQLTLDPGLVTQETVTFTSKSGTGPFTFNLTTALNFTHPSGNMAVRTPTATDTMNQVVSEVGYDPTFDAGNRQPVTASFSPGLAQSTLQFFMAGTQATNTVFAHVGLTDKRKIGDTTANLHNYAALGYTHNTTNDVEVDVTYTTQAF